MDKKTYISDRVGIAASAVCMVHCLIFPLMVLLRVPLSEWLHEFWHTLDYVFLAVSFLAVYFSSKSTPKFWMKYFLWTSFFALGASVTLKHHETVFEALAVGSALLLITAHLINIRQLSCRINRTAD